MSNLRTATAFFAVTLLGISGAIASMTFPAAGSQAAGGPGVEIALPSPGPDWIRLPAAGGEFSPEFYGAHSVSQARYRRGADTVSLLIVHYESQRQGSELISSRNRIFDAETWWIRFEGENAFSSDETGETLGVIELSLSDGERNQLIWSWYSISGSEVSNDFSAKLANFRGIISGKGKSASMVAIAARYENDVDVARSALRAFIADNLAPIRHSISRVSEVPGTQEP